MRNFFVCFCMVFSGFNIGGHIAKKMVRNEAIKAGVAEWTITKEGEKVFKWKTTTHEQ